MTAPKAPSCVFNPVRSGLYFPPLLGRFYRKRHVIVIVFSHHLLLASPDGLSFYVLNRRGRILSIAFTAFVRLRNREALDRVTPDMITVRKIA